MGTKLATCDPQPSLGGVYKLAATRACDDDAWEPVVKLSEQAYKRTIPGVQRVLRHYDDNGCPMGDLILDDGLVDSDLTRAVDVMDPYTSYDLSGYVAVDLLEQLVEKGHGTDVSYTLESSRRRCHDALMRLDAATRRFLNPQPYPVGIEEGLARVRERLSGAERMRSGRE